MFTSANLEAAALNTWQHHLKTTQQLGDTWAVRFGIFSAATCCIFMLFALIGPPCDQNCQNPSLLILGSDRARTAAIRQSHPLQVKMTNDVGSISSGTYYSSANCGPFFGSPVWRDIRAYPLEHSVQSKGFTKTAPVSPTYPICGSGSFSPNSSNVPPLYSRQKV